MRIADEQGFSPPTVLEDPFEPSTPNSHDPADNCDWSDVQFRRVQVDTRTEVPPLVTRDQDRTVLQAN